MVARINSHIFERDLIPPEQCGFVQGKSTTHQLYRIREHVKTNLASKSSTGMLLIDVEKAFDRVCRAGLIFKMLQVSGQASALLPAWQIILRCCGKSTL